MASTSTSDEKRNSSHVRSSKIQLDAQTKTWSTKHMCTVKRFESLLLKIIIWWEVNLSLDESQLLRTLLIINFFLFFLFCFMVKSLVECVGWKNHRHWLTDNLNNESRLWKLQARFLNCIRFPNWRCPPDRKHYDHITITSHHDLIVRASITSTCDELLDFLIRFLSILTST